MNSLMWKWIRTLSWTLGVFFCAEGLLRLFEVGYPTALLLSRQKYATAYVEPNPFYAYRFFQPESAPLLPPYQSAGPKPAHLIRVAVLAEQTALMEPAHAFSLARGLDHMLNPPGSTRRFEVINLALPAMDSPVAVDMARGLTDHLVDMLVVYLGNNEVVGPFGLGDPLTGSRWGERMTPVRAWATRFRLVGLLQRMTGWLSFRADEHPWPEMNLFRHLPVTRDDPRLAPLQQRFAENLERIVRIAESHGTRTLLCTVPVNLSDQAPFGSTNRTDLTSAQRRAWNEHFHQGCSAQDMGRQVAALDHFQKARAIDDQHAELTYRTAEAWRSTGDHETARRLFSLARDQDTLRLRADSRINEIIRGISAEHPDTLLADIQFTFSTLDDRDLFLDHTHFSPSGLQVACREIVQKLGTVFDVPAITTRDALMASMMRTPWSEWQEAEAFLYRRSLPPFAGIAGNERHVERLERQKAHAEERMASHDRDRLARIFAEQLGARPDDPVTGAMWGFILGEEGRWQEAATFLSTLAAKRFSYTDLHGQAAHALAMNGQATEAAQLLARTGPPYGYTLSRAAIPILHDLNAENRQELAHHFLSALREEAGRYPGHRKVARLAD